MIPSLRGWHQSLSGDRITLRHPDGEHVAAIRYRESVRPLARASVVIEDLLARSPQFRATTVGPIQRGVNEEGEYTAHAVIAGTVNDGPAQRDVGLVLGDDDYALVTGVSLVPARFAELTARVAHLLDKDSHGRGLRRRRYIHRGPSGWQGLARGLTTEWQPPGFPGDPTLIHVLPAHPVQEPVESVLAQVLEDDAQAGHVVERVAPAEPIVLASGLTGVSWDVTLRVARGRLLRVVVALSDARYLYVLRLETLAPDAMPAQRALLEVLGSIEPLPSAGRAITRTVSLVASPWAD
jgi:hypothetical protein